MDPEKLAILQENITMRDKEIQDYQINIDNYTRAIAKIDETPNASEDMMQFREVLQKNLNDAKREQMKSQLIRDVMQDQLNEQPAPN